MNVATEGVVGRLRRRARALKRDTLTLYLACRDPRTPWYARAFTAAVVAYALSPIDLIPDFVPVLGYLDDLVLVPLGLAIAIRMVPDAVLIDCRAKAAAIDARPSDRRAVAVIVLIWLLAALLVIAFVARLLR